MFNESSFALLGNIIKRKSLQMSLSIGQAGMGREHRLNITSLHKCLDAYALERIQTGCNLKEVQAEISKVGELISSHRHYRTMIEQVDGRMLLTALTMLQQKHDLQNHEAKLALFILQMSCARHLICEPVQAEVVPD